MGKGRVIQSYLSHDKMKMRSVKGRTGCTVYRQSISFIPSAAQGGLMKGDL